LISLGVGRRNGWTTDYFEVSKLLNRLPSVIMIAAVGERL
jgi:hypothetical protein